MNNHTTTNSDEIWSLIKETQKNLKELSVNHKEAKQEMKEIRASQKDTDEQIKETIQGLKESRKLFETQWGKLMESLVEGDLLKHLQSYGIEVKRTSTNEKGLMSYRDEKGNKKQKECEIDIIAKNGKEVIVVEVKTTLKVDDIKKFLKTLKYFTQLLPEYKNKTVYGATAYLRAEEESSRYAENQGLFVIRATGNSSSIINKKDFKPKVFS